MYDIILINKCMEINGKYTIHGSYGVPKKTPLFGDLSFIGQALKGQIPGAEEVSKNSGKTPQNGWWK